MTKTMISGLVAAGVLVVGGVPTTLFVRNGRKKKAEEAEATQMVAVRKKCEGLNKDELTDTLEMLRVFLGDKAILDLHATFMSKAPEAPKPEPKGTDAT